MSEFAACLKALLYDTGFFEPHEWSKFLGKPPEKIQAWLDDQDIPGGYDLSMILITLTEGATPNREPLDRFLAMSRKRATQVSPHGARMLPTVEAYANRPLFGAESSTLAKLDKAGQERYLLEKYPE